MKKKEERDGMQSEDESGRNASTPGRHVPRISRSIMYRMVVLGYIVQVRVSESIRFFFNHKKKCLGGEGDFIKQITMLDTPLERMSP